MKFLAPLVFAAGLLFGPTSAWAPPTNTFYMQPGGGSSTATCDNPGTPCSTLTQAVNQALQKESHGQQVTVQIAGGNFNESVNITGVPRGSGSALQIFPLLINGAGAASTVWNGATNQCGVLIANTGANVWVQNLLITAQGNPCQSDLYSQLGGIINVGPGMVFGLTSANMINCEGTGSQIQIWNGIATEFGGAGGAMVAAVTGCVVEFNPTTVGGNAIIMNGAPSFAEIFSVQAGGVIYWGNNWRILGVVSSGAQFFATTNGVIYTGIGCSFLPGTPGGTASGGQCS